MANESEKESKELERRIAASNLSQLQYYVSPTQSGNILVAYAYAIIPNIPFALLAESLELLGLSVTYPTEEVAVEPFGLRDRSKSVTDTIIQMTCNPKKRDDTIVLRFSKEGVAKLIAGGVNSPTLDCLRGRRPAALGTIQRS